MSWQSEILKDGPAKGIPPGTPSTDAEGVFVENNILKRGPLGSFPVTTPDGIAYLSNYTTINDALTSIGAAETTLIVNRSENLTVNTAIPENILVIYGRNGLLRTTGHDLSINRLQADPTQQIFDISGGGDVMLDTLYIPYIYPNWFGAKGDDGGITDCTAAFQAACDQIANVAGGGGTVRIPPGLYSLTSTITIAGKIVMEGDFQNHGVRILWDGPLGDTAFDILAVGTTNFHKIKGINFRSRTNTPGIWLNFGNCVVDNSVEIRSVHFAFCSNACIFVANGLVNWFLNDIRFDIIEGWGIKIEDGGNGTGCFTLDQFTIDLQGAPVNENGLLHWIPNAGSKRPPAMRIANGRCEINGVRQARKSLVVFEGPTVESRGGLLELENITHVSGAGAQTAVVYYERNAGPIMGPQVIFVNCKIDDSPYYYKDAVDETSILTATVGLDPNLTIAPYNNGAPLLLPGQILCRNGVNDNSDAYITLARSPNGGGSTTYFRLAISDVEMRFEKSLDNIAFTQFANFRFFDGDFRIGPTGGSADEKLHVEGNVLCEGHYQIDGTQVVTNRIIDAALANAPNTGDAGTDALITAMRDLISTHGLGRSA